MENLYETLGVPKNASQDEIKRAYRKLSMKNHPDMGGDTATFQKINLAYKILKDEEKRRRYDETGESESSTEQTTPEDFFREWVAKNVFTNTSVDDFVPGYPKFFSRSDEFEDPETGDIPWSSQDVKIMKWERAHTMLTEQIKLLDEYLGDLTKAPYEKLMPPDKLLRLLVGLKQDKFIGSDEYDHAIDLIDEYEAEWELLAEHRAELQRQEQAKARAEFLSGEYDEQINKLENRINKPMSGDELSDLTLRKGQNFKHLLPKDNMEVATEKAEGKNLSWKEHDERSKWRKEEEKIRNMGGPGGLK